ncbi:MAG: MoaD/ThiS family protein [Chloroflexi bacterium]|nr:MoaD/ThiS family protein [Chloroflexota bacterium]
MALVYIPPQMRGLTGGQARVKASGRNVAEVVEDLERVYPGIRERLVEGVRIRRGISVAVDGEVTPLGLQERVGEESEVHFLPAIGGGRF